MPYAPNNPYHNRTPGAGPAMYYPIMQPHPPGANGATAGAGVASNAVGMQPPPLPGTSNVVVPPIVARPKKALTITVR